MKRVIAFVLCCILLCASALAEARAIPNQKLAFRTGPGTKYTWLYHMPQDTRIVAIEYESSSVTWVQVEFTKNGKKVRAYTGLKRMSVCGDIPWADHMWLDGYITKSCTVYAAPFRNADVWDGLSYGDVASILEYENNYAYIEYWRDDRQELTRGYVLLDAITTEYDYSGCGNSYDHDYDYGSYYDYGYDNGYSTGWYDGWYEGYYNSYNNPPTEVFFN